MTATYRSKSKQLGKNFGRRNQAVVPVGAWVEVADSTSLSSVEVFESAQIEEERIKQRQEEKEARLHQFQRDVRDRVREIHRQRRERQLEASSQAVDLQQRILINGGRGATRQRGGRQKRDKIYRRGNIQISSDKENFGDGAQEEGEEEVAVDPYQLNKLSERIGNMVKTAKRELASRKVTFEKGEIPGGRWGESFTRDITSTEQPQGDVSPSLMKQVDGKHQEQLISPVGNEPVHSISDKNNDTTSNSVKLNLEGEGDACTSVPPQVETDQCQRSKRVTFDPGLTADRVANEGEKRSVKKREMSTKGGRTTAKEMVDVRPGVVQEERKRQAQEEVLMYRRLFMDMERENVQENRRREQHQKRIQRLKKAKEEERLAMERQSEEATEPKDPETGLTEAELMREQREDQRRAEAEIEKQRRKKKKERETKRYIHALRAQMKEKMDHQGMTLPPLCPCGVTAWDCNPDTCANNCVFYRNPKAYAKALSSLLNSSEFG